MLTGIEIKIINHVGIVDELGIVDIINQGIRNSGEIVKAILINRLGFVSKKLYLFP